MIVCSPVKSLPVTTSLFSPKMCTPDFEGHKCGSEGRESVCNSGNPGSIPGLERSPGEENGYPLQYSCLDYSMDKGT